MGTRGRYGTLSPITPRKRSGRESAQCHATGAPPIVPGDHGFFSAQGIQQANHVAGQMKQTVLIDCFGTVGLPVASHIRRDRMKTCFRQRW